MWKGIIWSRAAWSQPHGSCHKWCQSTWASHTYTRTHTHVHTYTHTHTHTHVHTYTHTHTHTHTHRNRVELLFTMSLLWYFCCGTCSITCSVFELVHSLWLLNTGSHVIYLCPIIGFTIYFKYYILVKTKNWHIICLCLLSAEQHSEKQLVRDKRSSIHASALLSVV